MSRPLAATALGLLLLVAPSLAQDRAANPGIAIDVIVQKRPGGTDLVVGRTGPDGWFRGPLRVQAGEYQVEGRCRPRVTCRDFRLATVRVDGRVISPNARGQFVFPVGSGTGEVRLEVHSILQDVSTPR